MNRNSQRNKARAAEFLAACYTAPLDDTAAAAGPAAVDDAADDELDSPGTLTLAIDLDEGEPADPAAPAAPAALA